MSKPLKRHQSRKPVARSAAGADAPAIRTDRSIRSLRAVENSFEPETRTFECVAATETPVRSCRSDGWNFVEVDEVLTISQDAIANWDRIPGTSICVEHVPLVPAVVGVVRSARIEDSQLILTCQLSSRADVDDLAQDVADGIIQNFSVRAELREEAREDRDGDTPIVTVTSWELSELSIVAVPADQNARLRSMSKTTPAGATRTGTIRRAAKKPVASIRARRSDDQVEDTEDEDTSERSSSRLEAEENVEALEAALAEARAALDDMDEDDDTERSDEEDDDTSERDGVDDAAEDVAERRRSKRSAGRTSTRSAAEQAQIKAFRAIAVRNKTLSGDEFDAFVSSGVSLRSLQKIALRSVTAPTAAINTIHQPVDGAATGGTTRLRSFHEYQPAADAGERN